MNAPPYLVSFQLEVPHSFWVEEAEELLSLSD